MNTTVFIIITYARASLLNSHLSLPTRNRRLFKQTHMQTHMWAFLEKSTERDARIAKSALTIWAPQVKWWSRMRNQNGNNYHRAQANDMKFWVEQVLRIFNYRNILFQYSRALLGIQNPFKYLTKNAWFMCPLKFFHYFSKNSEHLRGQKFICENVHKIIGIRIMISMKALDHAHGHIY